MENLPEARQERPSNLQPEQAMAPTLQEQINDLRSQVTSLETTLKALATGPLARGPLDPIGRLQALEDWAASLALPAHAAFIPVGTTAEGERG